MLPVKARRRPVLSLPLVPALPPVLLLLRPRHLRPVLPLLESLLVVQPR